MCQIGRHTRDYSLYASWVADYGDLIVLLGSYDYYSYLNQKDHRKIYTYIYIYKIRDFLITNGFTMNY